MEKRFTNSRIREGASPTASAQRDRIGKREREEERAERIDPEFRRLAENAPDVIARFDRELRHLYVNPAVERVSGIPARDFLGKTNRELGMPEELCAHWDRQLGEVFATGEEQVIEFAFPTPSGSRYYQTRAVPEFGEDGRVQTVLGISRDLTGFKRVEEALERSRRNYASLINSIDGIVWECDARTFGFSFVSEQAERILGYPVERWLTEPKFWQNHLHPGDRDSALAFCLAAVAEQRNHEFEYRMLAADGRAVWLRDTVTVVVEEGQATRLRGILVDVTEQRQAEQALRESEQRFRLMADHAPALIWVSETDKLRTWFNKPWLEFTGRTMEQEQGDGWSEGIHPDDFDRSLKISTGSFDRRERFEMEYRLRRGDGEYRWVLDIGVPRFSPEGSFEGYIGSCIDITERKRAEEALRFLARASDVLASSLDYEATLATVARMAVPFFADWCVVDILDEKGSFQAPAVAHVDPTKVGLASNLRKRYPVKMDSEHVIARVARTGRPEFMSEISPALLAKAAQDEQHLQILHDLGLHSYLCVPLVIRGRTFGALTLVTAESRRRYEEGDLLFAGELARRAAVAVENARLYGTVRQELAERKRSEEELRQKNQELEQFVYTVSHDLKSPLVTIQGFAGILREDLAAGRLHELADSSERIERAAHRMSDLIGDLLQLSRVGRVHYEPQDVDVWALVGEIGEEMEERLERAGAVLDIEDGMATVFADRARLRDVFENLLTNALKYGCRGPHPKIHVGAKTIGDEVRFFVQDHGPGIAKQFHEKIFGLFQRLESDQKGTGVGLAIVARIMQMHRGRAWVESTLGKGATFWVALPRNGARSDECEEERPPSRKSPDPPAV